MLLSVPPAHVGPSPGGYFGLAMSLSSRDRGSRPAPMSGLYRAALDASPLPLFLEKEGIIAYANPAGARFLGAAAGAELIGHRAAELQGAQTDGQMELLQYRFAWKGRPVTVHALRDVAERRRLERRLLQAQKLETLGRLAGGIVHDFNNLLTAINLYADLLAAAAKPPQQGYAEQIRDAARRGEELVRQLLLFARQQPAEARVLSLNSVLSGMSDMLQRLLGEDISLEVRRAEPLPTIKADAVQLEQVILNLAINARDAMPQGGKLIIETAAVQLRPAELLQWQQRGTNLRPGSYVQLVVRDTGCGMDEATRLHAFEPFFTTKQGRGTGLGLPTVQGIVTQCGGAVVLDSAPGKGTTATVVLPQASVEQRAAVSGDARPSLPQGKETVLLVEDDAATRTALRQLLQGCGYKVLAADNGAAAWQLARRHARAIHLLLSDVVLPGESGRRLAQRLRRLHPRMRVLFTSGYGPLRREVGALPAREILHKPFTQAVLAQRVRQALDGRGSRRRLRAR